MRAARAGGSLRLFVEQGTKILQNGSHALRSMNWQWSMRLEKRRNRETS